MRPHECAVVILQVAEAAVWRVLRPESVVVDAKVVSGVSEGETE